MLWSTKADQVESVTGVQAGACKVLHVAKCDIRWTTNEGCKALKELVNNYPGAHALLLATREVHVDSSRCSR